MYEIKPIFDKSKVQVDVPTCMYKMKPVNDELQSGAASLTYGLDGAATNSHDLSDIQSRQSHLVKQLEVLRLKLNEMQKKLGDSPVAIRAESTTPSTTKPAAIRPIDAKHLSSIVLHVPPTKIPFSLLGIQRLWANRLNLVVEFFTHSTVLELTPTHKAFAAALTSFQANASAPTLNVSLIWKETPNTALVGLPGTFIPITGEVNVLRYLMRVGPNEFGYADLQHNLEVDSVFDLLYELSLTSSKDHRGSILKRLSQRLAKKPAFARALPNVCDIGALSVVKQSIKGDAELPANIKAWYHSGQRILCQH